MLVSVFHQGVLEIISRQTEGHSCVYCVYQLQCFYPMLHPVLKFQYRQNLLYDGVLFVVIQEQKLLKEFISASALAGFVEIGSIISSSVLFG